LQVRTEIAASVANDNEAYISISSVTRGRALASSGIDHVQASSETFTVNVRSSKIINVTGYVKNTVAQPLVANSKTELFVVGYRTP
jgi:hypothetical protein